VPKAKKAPVNRTIIAPRASENLLRLNRAKNKQNYGGEVVEGGEYRNRRTQALQVFSRKRKRFEAL
jgi:hypothetical protein